MNKKKSSKEIPRYSIPISDLTHQLEPVIYWSPDKRNKSKEKDGLLLKKMLEKEKKKN